MDIAGELASDIGEGAQIAGREIEDIYEELTDTTAKEGATSQEQDGSSGYSSTSDLYESIIESTATGDYPTSQMQEDLDDIGLSEDRIGDIKAEQEGYYYFDQLNSDQQSLYAQILHIMSCQADDIYVSTTDMDEVETVQQCVLNDHPEIFYIDGYV